ncbi:hypothetical protein HANVADRAFT_4341, partial [Hanseniaspora valbyensis NRRL Y-1626]
MAPKDNSTNGADPITKTQLLSIQDSLKQTLNKLKSINENDEEEEKTEQENSNETEK